MRTNELQVAFDNVALACEQYRGSKQEHIALESYLNLIKQELSKEPCTCKVETTSDGNK